MAIGAFLPDVMTRVVNVQWGSYDNTAVVAFGNAYVAVTNDGLIWEKLGQLGFGEFGGIEDFQYSDRPSEWLIKSRQFVLRGTQKPGALDTPVPYAEMSDDGFLWTLCDPDYGKGENTPEVIKGHTPADTVNGFKFRVVNHEAGIERSGDGGKSWELAYTSDLYQRYSDTKVIKDDGTPDGKPIVMCGADLARADPDDEKLTSVVISSLDGFIWQRTTAIGNFSVATLLSGRVERPK